MALTRTGRVCRAAGRTKGFTLVEMLVVVALMGLMLSLTIANFSDIGRGTKMRAAANELRSTIGLARQWAIANRESLFMLIPDDKASLYSGLPPTEKEQKQHRAYALYSKSKGYLRDWSYLPDGVYFVDQLNTTLVNPDPRIKPANNVLREGTLGKYPFPTASSGTPTLNAIEFRPDGTLRSVDVAPYEFFLSEGIRLESGNYKWKTDTVVKGLEINTFTGNVQINDYGVK